MIDQALEELNDKNEKITASIILTQGLDFKKDHELCKLLIMQFSILI